MKCKQCAAEISDQESQKALQWRRALLNKLNAQTSELAQEIQALENGFCGAHCEALSEGEA